MSRSRPRPDSVAFSDLARAAYCPRQLYYARREDDRDPPPAARERVDLAYRYPDLRAMDDAALESAPVDRPPTEYRAALARVADRDDYDRLTDPAGTRVFLAGKDAHGLAYKLLEPDGDGTDGEPPVPTIVTPGAPPESGVWEPQAVRAVAAAKALAWERDREVPRALVEYPAHGVVRSVRVGVRKTAAYRRALRAARGIDGPPPRLRGGARSNCERCAYADECGVRTRSLRSLLGL
ncbi:hypothetical protein [Candidatus Halobonum tyrrellensis]|uniref:CRISPR-associated exonuclease Cas4 n=1 Tax=Candidatus Halobonum tyrrellensis G22 TaxID=1324957 RepID=V4HD62_9EURY|nr:hypothetical protein [Candidatus Halobonum tyrrellensis]ESP88655.1 hypothetical protein K933_08068 [Candidatus Halobonum tyrrellensis G22]